MNEQQRLRLSSLQPSAFALLLQPILSDLDLRALAQTVDEAAHRVVADALRQLVARRFARLRIELGRIGVVDRIERHQRIGVVRPTRPAPVAGLPSCGRGSLNTSATSVWSRFAALRPMSFSAVTLQL